jgi:hypothetical protein
VGGQNKGVERQGGRAGKSYHLAASIVSSEVLYEPSQQGKGKNPTDRSRRGSRIYLSFERAAPLFLYVTGAMKTTFGRQMIKFAVERGVLL